MSVVTQKGAVRLGNFLGGKWVDSTAGDSGILTRAIYRWRAIDLEARLGFDGGSTGGRRERRWRSGAALPATALAW